MIEVTKENLVPGKEYFMECFTHDKNENLVSNDPPYKMIARFDKLIPSLVFINHPLYYNYKHSRFNNFRRIEYKCDKNMGYDVQLNDLWRFYEISENNVQRDMEIRAYDTILKNVIKDEYFRLEIL